MISRTVTPMVAPARRGDHRNSLSGYGIVPLSETNRCAFWGKRRKRLQKAEKKLANTGKIQAKTKNREDLQGKCNACVALTY